MARFIITGEYKDKATKAARKDLKGLSQDVKIFGKNAKYYYGIATAAAGYYAKKLAKDSVNAALEDERSQRLLALTLGNVASATDAAVVSAEAQISKMQQMYGIADDQLRPALARLARSTGNTSAALYDLQLALDISAATGKSLEAVTAALGKAQDGNVASLQRLGLGLDANLIKSKDTDKIFKQLRRTFSSFARQEASTVEGSFRRISVAVDEAQEIIGVALIDSINQIIATQGGVNNLTKSFNDLAYSIADTLRGFTSFVNFFNTNLRRINLDLVSAIPVLGGWLKGFQSIGKQQRINLSLQKANTAQVISARNAEYMALKAKKDAANETTDTAKKTSEQLMAEEAARKAGFKITEDIDSIQTVAAAKRLAEAKEYKMSLIDAAQSGYEAIKANADRLTAVWETQKAAFNVFKALLESGLSIPVAMRIAGIGGSTGESGNANSKTIPDFVPSAPAAPQFLGGGGSFGTERLALGGDTNVYNISVNAGAIGSEDYLVGVIGDALTKYTRYGNTTAPAGFI